MGNSLDRGTEYTIRIDEKEVICQLLKISKPGKRGTGVCLSVAGRVHCTSLDNIYAYTHAILRDLEA